MSRQFVVRLSVALVVTAAAAGGIVLLGDHGDPPPPGTVAVVGEPPATSVAPRTVYSTPPPTTVAARQPRDWTITYELTGSGTATVVYDENGLGLVHQELGVRLPWHTELTWPRTATAPTVQLLGQGEKQVGCRVLVGGSVVVQQSAPAGSVATCAGRLG